MHVLLPNGFSLLSTWELTLLSRHDATRMHDVENEEREQHHGRVEDVLICFLPRGARGVALTVFCKAEYDADADEGQSSVDGVE